MNVYIIDISQISLAKKCERGQTCFQFHLWNPLTTLFTSWLDLLQKSWISSTTQFVCLTPFFLLWPSSAFPPFVNFHFFGNPYLWQIYSKKWLRKQRKKFILSYFFLLPDNSQSFGPCVCQETFYWGLKRRHTTHWENDRRRRFPEVTKNLFILRSFEKGFEGSRQNLSPAQLFVFLRGKVCDFFPSSKFRIFLMIASLLGIFNVQY